MIYLISNRTYPNSNAFNRCSFSDFIPWLRQQQAYELDIETNVVEDITLREIYVIQFGSIDKKWQFIVDVGGITNDELDILKKELQDESKTKVGFNLLFEYSVIKQVWGVEIDNLFDVMVLLKIVLNGKNVPDHVFSLAGAVKEYLNIVLPKEEQTSFSKLPLTEPQIIYAAKDVTYCSHLTHIIYSWEFEEPVFIWSDQHNNWVQNGSRKINIAREMQHTIDLRMKALPALGDILCEGWVFDKDQWESNIAWAKKEADKTYAEMCNYIRENMKEEAEVHGFLVAEDHLQVKWNSSKQKSEMLAILYPELENTKMEALRKFAKTLPDDNYIDYIIDKQYDALNHRLVKEKKDLLKGTPYFFEKGKVTVNFDSPKQRLELFKLEFPFLTDTKEETLSRLKGPLIEAYQTYVKKTKLASSYGRNWYGFICSDGKIRPTYIDPVLVTGRLAISKPGIMTVPADGTDYREYPDEIGDRYREAFRVEPGWKVSAVDFASQELAIIAEVTGEPVFIDALKNGKDLHSISGYKVFKDDWLTAGGDADGNVKPKTTEGMKMRDGAKTITFGLAYGAGSGSVGRRLKITQREADEIISKYFQAFPSLKIHFDRVAKLGQAQGWVATRPPYNFRRNFADRNPYSIDRKAFGSIGRESKNFGIQAEGAIQSLMAMYLIKKYIKENNLSHLVKFVMMLHDATVCKVKEEYAEEWGKIHVTLMEEAARTTMQVLDIKGDLSITDTWTK